MYRTKEVDVAIIGAGTAGLSAYSEVSKTTKNFVLINGGPSGTTCARVGCMPSKVLIQVANDFHRRHVLAREGIVGGENLRIEHSKVLEYVRSLRDHFVRGIRESLEKLGDHYIQGYARFRDPTILEVEGQSIRAKQIIIATGSNPIVPAAWQTVPDRILTTDTLFEQDDLPSSMAVIGMGAIGVEMGQALARLGLHLIGLGRADQVAGLTDPEVNAYMHVTGTYSSRFGASGLTDPEVNAYMHEALRSAFPLHTGTETDVHNDNAMLTIRFDGKAVCVDKILASLGRRLQVAHLGLEQLSLPLDEHGLPPYDPTTLQVGDLPIFIAGDVNGNRPVLHEAADDGRIAGFNSVQEKPHCFQRRTRLSIVFSEPNVAVVGSSFAELQNQDIVIGMSHFDHQGRATIMAENFGILRVYGDKHTGHLRGAELAAPRGEHLAHLLAWAIQKELTVFELLQLPFYHPVVEEGLRTALRDLAKQVHAPRSGFEQALCDSAAAGIMS